MGTDYKQLVTQFFNAWQREKNQKIKICLFGQPGAGKSSLINELAGQRVAHVSQATDTTRQAQIVECQDVIYVDLPGYDTSLFPGSHQGMDVRNDPLFQRLPAAGRVVQPIRLVPHK